MLYLDRKVKIQASIVKVMVRDIKFIHCLSEDKIVSLYDIKVSYFYV